jgi:ribosomal protein S18 acetylase RimI-like enzyme
LTEEQANALKSWHTPEGIRHTMAAYSMARKVVFMARDGERAKGLVIVGQPAPNTWGGEIDVEIDGLYVDPKCHGRGIGTALMKHVFDDIAPGIPDGGEMRVGAIVLKKNTRTIERNQRRGYAVTGDFDMNFQEYRTWKPVPLSFYKMVKTLE